jgi:hypothetical protein
VSLSLTHSFACACARSAPDPSELHKIAPKEIQADGQDAAGRASARARDWLGKVPGWQQHGSVKYSAETEAALLEAGFVALPVKAGDLVCFPGTTDHLSLANHTPHARHTYQLHLVEGPGAGVEWSRDNWMQYPPHLSFPSLAL